LARKYSGKIRADYNLTRHAIAVPYPRATSEQEVSRGGAPRNRVRNKTRDRQSRVSMDRVSGRVDVFRQAAVFVLFVRNLARGIDPPQGHGLTRQYATAGSGAPARADISAIHHCASAGGGGTQRKASQATSCCRRPRLPSTSSHVRNGPDCGLKIGGDVTAALCHKRTCAAQQTVCDCTSSISSSVSIWSELGTSMPSAQAVCRLMTNSNLVACKTSRSANWGAFRLDQCGCVSMGV
jgi:hypothetical protein